MKRWTILTALFLVLFACGKEEEIPPSLRPDHEKPEQPTPTPPEPGPEPVPEPVDDLHDKVIPEDFRIPEVHITTENGKGSRASRTGSGLHSVSTTRPDSTRIPCR